MSTGVCTQPVAGSQLSFVQTLRSSQTTSISTQRSKSFSTAILHLLSGCGHSVGVQMQMPPSLHVPAHQSLPSQAMPSSSRRVPHWPLRQMSLVHGLLSSQLASLSSSTQTKSLHLNAQPLAFGSKSKHSWSSLQRG